MSEDDGMQRSPRARPVAGLPLDAVAGRAEELARRWAIALVLERPLPTLGELPLEDIAREAPGLCAALLRAVGSDSQLAQLTAPDGADGGQGARRLAALCRAPDAPALARAVEALRGVLWEALLEQFGASLGEAPARVSAEACDRLAYVCAAALAAALEQMAPALPEAPEAVGAPAPEREPRGAGGRYGGGYGAPQPAPTAAGAAPRSAAAPLRAVIVDELEERPRERRELARSEREIEARDARRGRERSPWIAAIARELDRFRRDGRPFAVLLVEVHAVERLHAGGAPRQAGALAAEAERLLAAELRAAARARQAAGDAGASAEPGSVARDSAGRLWLLSPHTDRVGALELARRLERAVARPARHGGGLVDVVAGTAVCPDDGTDAASLAEHADLELYAARGAAVSAQARGGAMPPFAGSA